MTAFLGYDSRNSTEELTMEMVQTIALLCGLVISPIVAFVTKSNASSQVKSAVVVILSALAGAIATTVYVNNTTWQDYVRAIVITFVTAVAAHYGFHKPMGISPAVARKTHKVGLG